MHEILGLVASSQDFFSPGLSNGKAPIEYELVYSLLNLEYIT